MGAMTRQLDMSHSPYFNGIGTSALIKAEFIAILSGRLKCRLRFNSSDEASHRQFNVRVSGEWWRGVA